MSKFEIYQDRAGEYRWKLRSTNQVVIASSAEGYSSRDNCLRGIDSVKMNAPAAELIEMKTMNPLERL